MREIRHREVEGAAQIDALQIRGRDAPQVVRSDRRSSKRLDAIDRLLHVHRVPRQHGVGQQAQGGRDRHDRMAVPREFGRDLGLVDRALHGMQRFAAIEHVLQFGAERGHREIVDQENRPEQFAQRDAAVVQRLAACRRTESRQRLHGRAVTALHRRGDAHEVVPDPLDGFEPHIAVDHGQQAVGHVKSNWHVKSTVAQMREPWAQIEAEPTGQPHPEIRVAMGVDR